MNQKSRAIVDKPRKEAAEHREEAAQDTVPELSQDYVLRGCQAGGRLRLAEVQGGEPTTIIAHNVDPTRARIADHFAERYALSDCTMSEADGGGR